MKIDKKILYILVVVIVIAVAAIGWYYTSSVGKYASSSLCPKWKCTDTKTYTCPSDSISFTCSSGLLTCNKKASKDYYVTLLLIAPSALSANFTVNGEFLALMTGQSKTLSDGTIFTLTHIGTIPVRYAQFSLSSSYETNSSSLYSPLPSSTTIPLIVSTSVSTYTCPSGYTPSCSGNTLTCTFPAAFICSPDQPFPWCTRYGSCSICPV